MATKKTVPTDVSKYRRLFWQIFLYGFLGIILLFLFASWGFFGKMPSFDELENKHVVTAPSVCKRALPSGSAPHGFNGAVFCTLSPYLIKTEFQEERKHG